MNDRRKTPTKRKAMERRTRFWTRRKHAGITRILWIPVLDIFTRSNIAFP